MSTEMQTKMQASPTQNFTPVQTGLLQRKSALCNTPGLVEDSKRDQKKLTLQRSSVYQAGITMVPRFGHDFSSVSVHSTGPGMIQTKLKINEPEDIYEQEADRVADAVMRMSELGVQREVEPEEEEEPVQAKRSKKSSPEVSPSFDSGIKSIRGGGQPMLGSTRNYFESRFGADFTGVRVHHDDRASYVAQSLNARAFTLGLDIVFNKGQYAPESLTGKRLFAHELTHVLQQNNFMGRQAKRGGTKNTINHHIDTLRIQRYNKDVHYGRTKIWAVSVFGKGQISEEIAKEDQAVDSTWKHPTVTSLIAFAPEVIELMKVLSLLSGALGLISKYIELKLRKRKQRLIKRLKKKFSSHFRSTDVLHFPKKQNAIRDVKLAIQQVRQDSGRCFLPLAARFGRVLHVYQDSFSHSFPLGSPYNSLKNKKFTGKNSIIRIITQKIVESLNSVLLIFENIYKPTLYGKGAVIRHIHLGNYPDDFMLNTEQIKRDTLMMNGTVKYLKSFKKAHRTWKRRAKTYVHKCYRLIEDDFKVRVRRSGQAYRLNIYQKTSCPLSLAQVVARLNLLYRYSGFKSGKANKKYFIMTTRLAKDCALSQQCQSGCFYTRKKYAY